MLIFIIPHSCNAIQKLDFLFCVCPTHPVFCDIWVPILSVQISEKCTFVPYNLTVSCAFTSLQKFPIINVCHDPSMPQYPDVSSSNAILWNTFAYLSSPSITGKPYQISQVGFIKIWVLTSYTHTHTSQKSGCWIKR